MTDKKTTEEVTEKMKLDFAKSILLMISLIFLVVFIANATINNQATSEAWEFISTALPPLATLVIGRYFGRK